MFDKILRNQEKQANRAVSDREKVLLAKVEQMVKLLKDEDSLNVQEAVQVLETAKARLNSALGNHKVSDLL